MVAIVRTWRGLGKPQRRWAGILAVWLVLGSVFALAASRPVVILGSDDPAPPGERFMGTETCVPCHQSLVEHWKTTAHAHAWATLEKTGDHTKPECVRCHSTGFGLPGGLNRETLEPEGMRDVHCETCHGPGERHLREVQLGAVSTYGCEQCAAGKMCIGCHTPSQDPDFDFARDWKAIAHPPEEE